LKTKPIVWSELLHNNNLQYLDLNFNKMGDEALAYIADTLRHNSQLKTLKVADNAGSHIPVIKLALALEDNNVLTEIDYLYCPPKTGPLFLKSLRE
jgi:Ran GTPase-activating protein (RanGAP) involved in mRNA processing and transport